MKPGIRPRTKVVAVIGACLLTRVLMVVLNMPRPGSILVVTPLAINVCGMIISLFCIAQMKESNKNLEKDVLLKQAYVQLAFIPS